MDRFYRVFHFLALFEILMAPSPPYLPSFLLEATEGILTTFETVSGGYNESDIEMPNCDTDNKFHNIFHDY